MYRVIIAKDAQKSFEKIPRKVQSRIVHGLDKLSQDPFIGKSLKGELDGKFSLRVWPYRIIYQISKKELQIQVIDIGHRQGIYQ